MPVASRYRRGDHHRLRTSPVGDGANSSRTRRRGMACRERVNPPVRKRSPQPGAESYLSRAARERGSRTPSAVRQAGHSVSGADRRRATPRFSSPSDRAAGQGSPRGALRCPARSRPRACNPATQALPFTDHQQEKAVSWSSPPKDLASPLHIRTGARPRPRPDSRRRRRSAPVLPTASCLACIGARALQRAAPRRTCGIDEALAGA